MKLNPKIAWGLAWAGLAVVVAVPSVDFLTGRGATETAAVVASSPATPPAAATQAPAPVATVAAAETPAKTTPAKTSTVTTTHTATGVIITPAGSTPPADPVDAFVKSGKALPDYLTESKAPAAATPAAPTAAPAGTQVAAIDPAPVVTAPKPFPRPIFASAPAAPAAPAATATVSEPVVIVDETAVTGAIGVPTGPRPPAPIVDDSANWETESLRQYLERRGILGGEGSDTRSSAGVTQRSNTSDPDGSYLSDGPNNDRLDRQRRLYQLFEESGENQDFTLF